MAKWQSSAAAAAAAAIGIGGGGRHCPPTDGRVPPAEKNQPLRAKLHLSVGLRGGPPQPERPVKKGPFGVEGQMSSAAHSPATVSGPTRAGPMIGEKNRQNVESTRHRETEEFREDDGQQVMISDFGSVFPNVGVPSYVFLFHHSQQICVPARSRPPSVTPFHQRIEWKSRNVRLAQWCGGGDGLALPLCTTQHT
ncbi:hypothetical protein GPALN_005012 [Globodera pallida]|nr:hypothetical protein GPALN_005012 [Globodera pallida]